MVAKGSLNRLLRPKSIAVIGGGSWCNNVIHQCQKIGYAGEIWPVHPRHAQISGLTAFRDVNDLPAPPDSAFVGVNRNATLQIVRALGAMDAGGAVCFAAGFSEAQAESADGRELQKELLRAAGDMRILGPNCYGFVNYLDGALLWPDQHGGEKVDSGVAIITQSSNIAMNLTMQTRGLPLAYVVTAGNQAQTGISEIGAALLEDTRVTALGLHIEGIDDLRNFEALAALAQKLRKPIVALKGGQSDQAKAATISHTASLAGSDAGANALFKRLGIARVASLSELLELLKLLHVVGPLSSGRIASMSCSGGEAILMADLVQDRDLDFPPLTGQQNNGLRNVLGPMVKLANPLDYNTYIWNDSEAMRAAITAMMQGDVSLGCLIADFPRADRCETADWDCVISAIISAKSSTDVPLALVASIAENLPEDTAKHLMQNGIAALMGLPEAVVAFEKAAWLGRARPPFAPVLLPNIRTATTLLTEHDAKQELAAAGITTPLSHSADTPAAAAKAALQLGFPVVLKGENIAHKTEAGAVALNLQTEDEVILAAKAMPATRFLVEKMIEQPVAELLVGVVVDPAHGYVLTLGAGGILTELMRDQVSLLVPASARQVQDALQSLRIAPLLLGYRKAPKANIKGIVAAIMAVQDYIVGKKGLVQELEINPLMCGVNFTIAADALIKTGE